MGAAFDTGGASGQAEVETSQEPLSEDDTHCCWFLSASWDVNDACRPFLDRKICHLSRHLRIHDGLFICSIHSRQGLAEAPIFCESQAPLPPDPYRSGDECKSECLISLCLVLLSQLRMRMEMLIDLCRGGERIELMGGTFLYCVVVSLVVMLLGTSPLGIISLR